MSQSIVTIRLNGTPYQIGCGPGEEARIEALGAEIDSVLQTLVGSVGQIGEARLLAMAALILADRAPDGQTPNGQTPNGQAPASANGGAGDMSGSDEAAAAALENAAERILALASTLSSH